MKFAAMGLWLVFVWPLAAHAAKPNIVLLGQGTRPCAEWIEERAQAAGIGILTKQAWLGGLVSGFNVYGPETSADVQTGMDADALWAWIDAYCQANPADQLAQAGAALIDDLRRRHGR